MECNIVQHTKRGTLYDVVGTFELDLGSQILHDMDSCNFAYNKDGYTRVVRVTVQTDLPVTGKNNFVLYQAHADGTFWIRPDSEFYSEGRFTIPNPPNLN